MSGPPPPGGATLAAGMAAASQPARLPGTELPLPPSPRPPVVQAAGSQAHTGPATAQGAGSSAAAPVSAAAAPASSATAAASGAGSEAALEAASAAAPAGWTAAAAVGAAGLARLAFVLIDGLGDVHIRALGQRTPLEAAHTPWMDALASAGVNGLLDPVEPGLACGSDTAHLSILGYDPRRYYRGRGAFESMGTGLDMTPGDIAFKCNFATLDPATGIVVRRRADRRFEELGPILCEALNGTPLPSFPQHSVAVRYATEHRCGVVVRGPGLSDAITGTDPLKDNLPLQVVRPTDDSPEAAHTAAVVNELSATLSAVLAAHPINAQRVAAGQPPANIVLLRGCGSRIAVQPFTERHGLRGAMVAPTKIIAGLGLSLGIDRLEAPGATGDYRSQFHAKAQAVADALISGGYDFAFLHVKAVDDTGHDREPALKVAYLEVVDIMVGQLLRRLAQAQLAGAAQRFAVAVTGDHSTPVLFGDHSHEPVPFTIASLADLLPALRAGDAAAASAAPTQPAGSQNAPPQDAGTTAPSSGAPAPNGSSAPAQAASAAAAVQPKAGGGGLGDGASLAAALGTALAGVALVPISHPAEGQPPLEELAARADKRAAGIRPLVRPGAVRGDGVSSFGETAAARGFLGRFPGSQVMPLVKQFVQLA